MTTDEHRHSSETEAISFGRRIGQLASRHPDNPAVVFAPGHGAERQLSWGQLEALSNQAARLLEGEGVRQKSLVVIGLPNSLEHVVSTLAVWKLGGCVLPLNAKLPTAERDQILEIARARLIVADWTDLDAPFISSAELNDLGRLSAEPVPDRISHPGKAIASGGSTGRSKIIINPTPLKWAPGEIARLAGWITGMRPGQVQLVTGPMYHHAPFSWVFFGLFEKQTIVLMERFEARQAVDLIERYRVNFTFMVPTMMRRIIRLPGIEERDLSSLESLYHSAGPCAEWLKDAWIDLIGAEKIYEAYGSTEEIGFTCIRGDEWLRHRGSVGRGESTDIRILDPDGNDLPAGSIGEVFMRRKVLGDPTYEYLGSPPAKSTPDGFASVGDLGWLDEEGYLFLADRRVDMIVSGGANVYPAEVEGVLTQHRGVEDVAVVGVPDEEWGRRVHAIVKPVDPAHPPSRAELDEHCRGRISSYKVPKSYEFRAELPRNQAGKIRRSALAETPREGPE